MSDPRRPTVLGVSLKLYLSPERSVDWAIRVAELARGHRAIEDGAVVLFVLPSLPALDGVRRAIEGSGVRLGAQDLFWAERGAYTGAVSGLDLRVAGCDYVEVGHAERRRWFGEDDEVIGRKLAAAFRTGLVPVLCIGEATHGSPADAVRECVDRLDAILDSAGGQVDGDLVIAYEPEWAIGSDRAADPEHVNEVCAGLRARLATGERRGITTIIYGGSAAPGLLPRLGPEVDGLFLGRFAHDPAALAQILDETAALR